MHTKIIFFYFIIQLTYSQETTVSGNYKVNFPTNSNKLEIDILDNLDKKQYEIKAPGKYVIISQKYENYKIFFEANSNKKFVGNIIVVNYYPGDSTFIEQNDSKFISSKHYRNKELIDELKYLGDSIFIYKNYFSDASYEGKTKLIKYGYSNIEHKEFDINKVLKEYQYFKDGIRYNEEYKDGVLVKQKFILKGEKTIKYFNNKNLIRKDIYLKIDKNCYIMSYNKKGVLLEKRQITSFELEKEFSEPLMSGIAP